jgi:hypothetical protein
LFKQILSIDDEPRRHGLTPTVDRAINKISQETPMPRSTMLAFVAVAALGIAPLAATAATASPNHGTANAHQNSNAQSPAPHFKGKPGLIGGNPISWAPQPKKPLIGGDPNTWTPSWVYHHHHHDRDWRWWYARYRYRVLPVETTNTVVAPAVTTAAANCNCLTKEYLPDGSVLFKDLCTKEAAMATPDELKAQAQGQGPQVR